MTDPVSERGLILTPHGRDAGLAAAMLGEAGLPSAACGDVPALVAAVATGAGFAVVTEEALRTADLRPLSAWIEAQPEWSDFPFVLLTERAGGLERNPAARRYLDLLGNVAFLERPFHPTSLVSLAQSALRGRRRQYEARARLEALREGEDHYRHALELNPQVAWTANPDGQLDRVAGRWQEWTGSTGLGATWGEAIHPDDLGPSVEAWTRSVATGEPYDVEHRVRLRDGSHHWMQSRAQARRDEAGRILRWYGTTEDIETRRTAEASLREESRSLETLNRAGAALVADLDVERLVQSMTDAGCELTGATCGAYFHGMAENGGRVMELFVLSGAKRSDFAALGKIRPTGIFGPTFRNEGVVRSDDVSLDQRYGHALPFKGMPPGHLTVRSYLGVSVASRGGDVLGSLIFGHPEPGRFTERHERLITGLAAQAAVAIDNARLFQAVKRSNETLETRVAERTAALMDAQQALQQAQKMEAVGQLTGGIAHDFNNLLQGVAGSLELIHRKPDDAARVRRWAEAGLDAASRGARLTGQLLAFSRAQRIQSTPVVVSSLVEGMRDLLERTLGPMTRIEIDVRSDGGMALTDATQLEMAILNMAINARDAMPDGGTLRIGTRLTAVEADHEIAAGDYVELRVADTGSGMTAEVAARAFDPFFTTKGIGKGTGLGLSQVYGIARQAGGTARIETVPGEGTTVRLLLRHTQGTPAEVEHAVLVEASGDPGAATILVVDDDAGVRRFMVESLDALGYRVVEAIDGPAGLKAIERDRPDLMVIDFAMPGMNGADVARAAREARPDLPVLFATGYSDTAAIEGAVGADAVVLRKPFRVAELQAAVAAALVRGA